MIREVGKGKGVKRCARTCDDDESNRHDHALQHQEEEEGRSRRRACARMSGRYRRWLGAALMRLPIILLESTKDVRLMFGLARFGGRLYVRIGRDSRLW